MKEETGMQNSSGIRESTGLQESVETGGSGARRTAEGRRGPGWKGWMLSILVAIILSVTATLLLGGSGSFRSDRSVAAGSAGTGGSCCPPGVAAK
jgi:hypothetical protein